MPGESPVPHSPDWSVVRLGDIALKVGSGATPRGGEDSYLLTRDRFALVRSQNVFDRRFDSNGLAFISDKQAEGLKNVILQENDLLLNITGDGITFARCCVVPKEILPACVNQHVAIIRVDPRLADPGYVLSYLSHPAVKSYIESFNAGGSRRAITKGHIESFELALPSLDEQRAIAHILGTLDDKIELNRRMNETLEAMARAIFKSWFVDFDPVRAKAEGRDLGLPKHIADLFPDRFEDSELGEIPGGWTIKSIDEVAERVGMGPFGSSIKVDTFVPNGVPVISGQHLNSFMLEDNKFNFITNDHAEKLNNSNVYRGDVVFTHAGNIGQAAFIPDWSRYKRYVISQRQFFMRCNPLQVTPTFIAFYFNSLQGQHQLLANTSSSGVPSIARPVTYLRTIKLVIPPRPVLEAFERLTRPFFYRFRRHFDEVDTLVGVRDRLLPKLLSGEVRVTNDTVERLGGK
jgi:type I restriction enzyme S subunit